MAAVKSNSKNTAQVLVTLCDETYPVMSNEVTIEKIIISLTKSASCKYVIPGNTVQFCVAIRNDSEVALVDVDFLDHLDIDATYVNDTFTVNSSPAVPTVNGRDISYTIPSIAAHTTTTICFRVKII